MYRILSAEYFRRFAFSRRIKKINVAVARMNCTSLFTSIRLNIFSLHVRIIQCMWYPGILHSFRLIGLRVRWHFLQILLSAHVYNWYFSHMFTILAVISFSRLTSLSRAQTSRIRQKIGWGLRAARYALASIATFCVHSRLHNVIKLFFTFQFCCYKLKFHWDQFPRIFPVADVMGKSPTSYEEVTRKLATFRPSRHVKMVKLWGNWSQ